MTSTVFAPGTTIPSSWMNDINNFYYNGLSAAGVVYSFGGSAVSYADTNILASFVSSVSSYNQVVHQNRSNGALASVNINVSNDAGTSTTNYGEFGMNSSGFTGTGSFSQAGNVYLAAASTDLVIGTYGAKAIRFVVNSGATDAAIIDASGNLGIGSAPTARLDVYKTAATTQFSLRADAGQTAAIQVAGNGNTTAVTSLDLIQASDGTAYLYNRAAQSLILGTNNIERMRLDSVGNFLPIVQVTPPTLGTNQQMTFNLTSNTNLRISVRGTDGVTRVANLTLA
jgi:hypothetical protein